MAKKYKDMTYTVRADGRLTKKVTINKKPHYIYGNEVKDLYKQYIELKELEYKRIDINGSSITVNELFQKWIELNSRGKAYRTIKEYNDIYRNYIKDSIGYIKVRDLKGLHIKELLLNLEDIPTTAKKTIQLLKRVLNEAVDNDFIHKNVAQFIKSPRINKKEKKPLTTLQDKLLLNNSSKYSSFFLLMRYTGMRREEIVPLTIDDIDLKNKKILINKAVTFINNQPVLKETKNYKSRTVPILDIIYNIVEELVNNAKSQKRNLLFVTERNSYMLTESAIKRHLESYILSLNNDIKKINDKENNEDKLIPKISFSCHILRHSYCTMLYYAGLKIKKAQELMGHSSADMVYNIYTHLDEERENSTELINNYIESINS